VHAGLASDLGVEGDAQDSTLARGHDPAVFQRCDSPRRRTNLHDLRGTNEDGLDGAWSPLLAEALHDQAGFE